MEQNIFPNEVEQNGILLISLFGDTNDEEKINRSLDELTHLVETSLDDTKHFYKIYRMTQNRRLPDPSTYIGTGKAQEASQLCRDNNIVLVVLNGELSPSQIRNLEDEINGKGEDALDVRVIDRTMLILDIFANHAVTGEGKLQVEIAQLKYTSPRLTGKGIQLSRQGGGITGGASGGIGARGPGESKLETDRRHLKRRILSLEQELKQLESDRSIKRKKRERSGIPIASIAGYTNAGKSTLLNYLTDAGVLAQDKLFATLDPTIRKLKLPSGKEILLSDTVGFISNLPHQLVEAFKSTLDEIRYADIILILIDASEEDADEKTKITEEILNSLDVLNKPTIYVFNKCDKLCDIPPSDILHQRNSVCISSLTGEGTDKLIEMIDKLLEETMTKERFLFPFEMQAAIPVLYKNAKVLKTDYLETGTLVEVMVDQKLKGQYRDYIVSQENTFE